MGDRERLIAAVQNVPVQLAKEFLAATEWAGKELTRRRGGTVDEGDTWTLDSLSEEERDGLILTATYLIDRGILSPGPNFGKAK